jgi:hypothetical protein
MSPDSWVDFVQGHPILAIASVAAFGIFVYVKPKPVFKLMAVVLIVGAIGYVISFVVDLTSTGIDEKTTFVNNPGRLER